ncbi:MAG: phage terminase large subunit [Lachnospiraceae bacterium]|nr:phage terminase large subunit [Lachnospiraceae bacterium]
MSTKIILAPQKGPQERFLATPADICIYGGAAGGGKTFGLLLEPLRHMKNKDFNSVIFRRDYTQVTSPGGLWDSSVKIYSYIKGSHPLKTPKLHWTFKSGATVNFAHLKNNEDCLSWQGSQMTMIGFDELTHFSEYQFFYMLSRNRTDSGISPYVRATCNPDADSWVAKFITWWIDPVTGYPIPERSGKIKWMVRLNEVINWFDTKQEAVNAAIESGMDYEKAVVIAKSVTFIASTLQDNKILMKNDPGYMANLLALALVERERLLHGNWKIKAAAGSFFKRSQIGEILAEIPNDLIAVCRGWDLAATDKNEDDEAAFTAGVLMGKRENGRFVIIDVVNRQLKAGDVRSTVLVTAKMDHVKHTWCRQRLPQDPGQAGKDQKASYMEMLAGFDVRMIPESGDKTTRAEPMAAQWQHGMFDLVAGEWNEAYLNQLESFPDSKFKDMVDASSSAFNEITLGMSFNIDNLL